MRTNFGQMWLLSEIGFLELDNSSAYYISLAGETSQRYLVQSRNNFVDVAVWRLSEDLGVSQL